LVGGGEAQKIRGRGIFGSFCVGDKFVVNAQFPQKKLGSRGPKKILGGAPGGVQSCPPPIFMYDTFEFHTRTQLNRQCK
jgi:hypothetical protein